MNLDAFNVALGEVTLRPMLVFFELLSAALFYTTFCRLAKLNSSALLVARAAYFVLGVVTVLCMYFAAFQGYTPSGPDCLLLGAFLFVQVISSRGWREKYPAHLSRPTPLDEVPNESAKATL